MIHRIICTLTVFMALNAFADWAPIVESKRDIDALPSSTLRVRARGLHDEDIPALRRLPLLKHLDFGEGRKALAASITDKGLAHLANVDLQHLDFLMLGYCTNITDAGLASVAKVHSITWLSLEVCPHITDAGLSSLLTMTNLTGLDLRGCVGITDAGLERLAAKGNWQTIMLGGCPNVTTNAVSKLQRTLPKAKIAKDEREWSFHK
jgi:Leucine Rich repeat